MLLSFIVYTTPTAVPSDKACRLMINLHVKFGVYLCRRLQKEFYPDSRALGAKEECQRVDARPETLKIEAEYETRRLGEGSKPPPNQLGVWEHCKLPQQGPGRTPDRPKLLHHF